MTRSSDAGTDGRRVGVSDSDILRHVGARAAEAGRVYQRQGRVVAFEESPPEIVARVQGSSPTPYSVRIKVAAADGQGPRIEGACSCPVGAYCKHIAATLIESRTRDSGVAAGRKSEPLSPTPGRQAQGYDPLPPHISQWIAALERAQVSESEAFPPDAPNRLIYVFSAPDYRHAPSFLQVEALSARVLKSGGFSNSASKPDFFNLLSENPPRYIRPSDVKIVRWLSVARGTAYSGPIRLRDDAAWEIIEAAIATGRARLDSHHGSPLTLGPDRSGKIVWKLGDDAQLRPVIEVEAGMTAFLAAPSGYIDRAAGVIGRLGLDVEPKIAATVLAAPPLPARWAAKVAALIEQRAPRAAAARPASAEPPLRIEQSPVPALRLFRAELPAPFPEDATHRRPSWQYAPPTEMESVALARLRFRYGAATLAPGETAAVVSTVAHGRVLEIVRRPAEEAAAVAQLAAQGLASAGDIRLGTPARHRRDFVPEGDEFAWFDFLYHGLPALREAGFVIEIDEDFPHRLLRGGGEFEIGLNESSGFDWFELDLGVTIEGVRVDLIGPICALIASPFFDAAGYRPFDDEDEPFYLPLPDGRCLALPIRG